MRIFYYFCDMDNPLISIITITFNASAELPITLKSVAEQTCRDFEHLLIDGASYDNTVAIAREIGGVDLRIVSEHDNGLYDAMNKGLKIARGKYVIFLNAGDAFANKEILEKYADKARQNADIIYSDTEIVDLHGKILRPRHLSVPELLTVDSFSEGMLICHQAFMVKRTIAPLYNLQYRFSADYDWTIRCIKHSKPENCVNLKCVGILYLDAGLTEKNKTKSLKERFDIMTRHYGIIRTVGKHLSFIPRAVARKFQTHEQND